MTLTQLRHFVCLAEAGSFVKASGQLFMTQPALSRSIKALEDELGQLLFDRVGKRIELTPFGRDVLGRSQALLDDAHQLKRSARVLGAEDTGRVRIGLSSGPGLLLTSALMQHFARHYPRFQVDVVRAHTQALTEVLRARSVDALVVDVRSLRPAPDLRVHEVYELPGAFMCRAGHPLAQQRKVTLAQLRGYPIAANPLSDELARILTERYGALAHPESLVNYTSDEISHLVEVAAATDTILLAVRACAPKLRTLPVSPALDANARFGLVTLANKAEALYLPQVRQVIAQVFAAPA